MWRFLARKILRNRIAFIVGLALATLFMGYHASQIQLSYEFARTLPKTDSTYIAYERFKKIFGEDGNIMVVGFRDRNLFELNKFNDWYKLGKDIKAIPGIQDVVSIANLYNVIRNDSLDRFDFVPIITQPLRSQQEADSVKAVMASLPFYEDLVYNEETGATVMAITFSKKDLNSSHRIDIVREIRQLGDAFEGRHQGLELHYSGMPYIRTAIMEKVSHEMELFMALAVAVTALILWVFFRSFTSVVFSLVVVLIGVVWALGTIQLLGYRITLLTGLIPPLIIVIGIPNCIFLINKYHAEYARHRNRMKALSRMIETIGLSLFLANITTAIGFGVLYFTNSELLVEFGVVAAFNVMVTYLVTLIFIPIILSVLPVPSVKHTRHLEGKRINKVLVFVDYLVHNQRAAIYTVIALFTAISLYGMTRISVIGFVVDDLPEKDPIYTDLRFFESNFKGVLPFEIFIDTGKENGVFADNAKVLYKIRALQRTLGQYEELSKPMSIVEALRFSYQAYRGGDPKYYNLPPIGELKKLSDYTSSVKGQEGRFKAFLDTTKRYTRISVQMKDIGSEEIKRLASELQVKADSIFSDGEQKVTYTGHSLMFLRGNDYLLKNLIESLAIEIILITIVGLALFRSFRIIILSKLPCLIPLVITAGIMGFLDIRFKPSTILIFSIAFGISSDGTIYFLAKYRHELRKNRRSISDAVSITIRETGLSMIYTAVILFSGFAIFTASGFGGTVALGVLLSITLLMSMATNLVLLPAFLLSLEKRLTNREFLEEPIMDISEDENETEEEIGKK